MFCPNCGQPQNAAFTFCSQCGCKLIQPENILFNTKDVPAAAPVSTGPACEQAPDAIAEKSVNAEAAPSNPYELPGEDPAAIPDESGTYVPPAQPYPPAPYPQYGYGYPIAAPQYPGYSPYGTQVPPYPRMESASYVTYNPYTVQPPHPGVPQYPQATPVMPPPEVKDVPPAKQGRRRVPVLIMVVLVTLGLLLFFLSRGKDVSQPQAGTVQSQSETPWFRNEDGTLYFDAKLYNGPAELTVPETVDGESVLCIAQDCFAGNDTITTVILPKGLEEIGSGAFADCTALRGIVIPEGVKLIGSGAFEDCSSLEAIYIPSSVAAIGRNTFRGCDALKHIMYDGTYEAWYELYSSYVAGETKVYCSDGTFPQGRIIP
jgi:hypothetical protein